jgi:hypothetical protein
MTTDDPNNQRLLQALQRQNYNYNPNTTTKKYSYSKYPHSQISHYLENYQPDINTSHIKTKPV